MTNTHRRIRAVLMLLACNASGLASAQGVDTTVTDTSASQLGLWARTRSSFRPDKPVKISSLTVPGGEGFASLANMLIEKDMRKCAFLPNEEVQRLLKAR